MLRSQNTGLTFWISPLFLSRGKIIPVAIGDVVDFCHVHRILLPHCLCNTEISILKAASGQHAGKWVGGCSMEHKRDRCGYFSESERVVLIKTKFAYLPAAHPQSVSPTSSTRMSSRVWSMIFQGMSRTVGGFDTSLWDFLYLRTN